MEPHREFKGGTQFMGLCWELDTLGEILKGKYHRWDFEGGTPWNPIDGNSREEPHAWGFEGGIPLMGIRRGNTLDGNLTKDWNTMDGNLKGETHRWDSYG